MKNGRAVISTDKIDEFMVSFNLPRLSHINTDDINADDLIHNKIGKLGSIRLSNDHIKCIKTLSNVGYRINKDMLFYIINNIESEDIIKI